MDAFVEISLIILLATGVAFILKSLKQPLIVGYILTGILIGPYVYNLHQSKDGTELLAKVGITILLFIVGLSLSPKVIKEIGGISLATGFGQEIITALIGYGICRLLGIEHIASLYISIALTFSSTIIISKLITDKGDAQTLYGKIAIGSLLVQDLIASLILIGVSSLTQPTNQGLILLLVSLILKGTVLATTLYLLTHYLLPKVLAYIATTQELLFLFSISWGMILATLFLKLGFSMEIGALVAGVCLSTTIYAPEIASRLKPLRDFFILLFFVLLGSQIALSAIPKVILPAIVLSAFVLIGNPLIVFLMMHRFGYKRKVGFMVGLTMAQISEFSLILAGLGVSLRHISGETLSLITLVGLITIGGSSYLIIYADTIYRKVEHILKLFEWRKNNNQHRIATNNGYEIILFGYHRVGADFVRAIQQLKKEYVVVDYDPGAIRRLAAENLPSVYGDAGDLEFLDDLGLTNTKLVISTIPDFETNKLVVQKLALVKPSSISIVISHNVDEALELYQLGAGYVIMPVYLGAQYATSLIGKYGLSSRGFAEERKKHLEHLRERKSVRDIGY